MNPSGLCLCGCGLPTTLARQSDTKRGWVKGEPTDYVHGHHARMPEYKQRQREESRERMEDRQMMRSAMQRRTTQKLGPYKAGRTVMAQKAVGKIEAAMKRRG